MTPISKARPAARLNTRCSRWLAILALLLAPLAATADEARLLRYPTIHGDFVVFVYAGDLWRAPSSGGTAHRLTSHPGLELTPKISPDGAWVAYSAEYSGTRQVYVIPSDGGRPRQLTFYNDVGAMPPRGGFDYWIQGWSPEGEILVRMNRTPWGQRPGLYYLVDVEGGLETPLPIQIGGSASYAPDGGSLAFTWPDREFRTWKRYQGGRNQDIWVMDMEAMESRRLTDWAGSDNFPMWHGEDVYYTSDQEHTLNVYVVSAAGGEPRKVTDFEEYDVLWPSLGPESIVFMNGGYLYRLDLATEETTRIPIEIADELPATVPHWKDVSGDVADADLSPDGKRAVFEARGDLFTVPAENGPTRNLTRTQGVRESSPAWSPDGRWIAYYSDETGEMELYVRRQDGGDEPRRITDGNRSWLYPTVWSPDGKKLAFGSSDAGLRVVDAETGAVTLADTGIQADIDTYRWSPDSRWLAYENAHPETRIPSLMVYSLESEEVSILGDGLTFDFQPAFSADGEYLFFLSNRDYNLNFSDFEFNYVYDNATRVYAAALDPATAPLFPLRSDEVAVDGDDAEAEAEDGETSVPRVEIEPDGWAARVVALPGVEAGNYADLTTVGGGVLYRKIPDGNGPALVRYDLESREEKEIASGVAQYVVGAGGDQVLYQAGGAWSVAPTKPGGEAQALDLSGLRMKLDPAAEWQQMFDEAWRIGRDWFYDDNMHGVDWEAMGDRYGSLVPFVAHRGDLDFLLGEMVSELEAGHAYVQSGDVPGVERVEGGMLGAELVADESGRYRFARIFPGENWDEAYRSPLTEQGVDVTEGDFLLAIDGVELFTTDNPYRLLEGRGGEQVALTVNDQPTTAGARTVEIRTITSETNLRYLDWVTSRMALVDELSDGRIGYLHLPNTAAEGNRMLQKLFYSQSAKPALIIDERYNGGGFIPDRMIEVFSRTPLSYWARRGVESMRTPGFAHNGPKAMLINGYAASGGDALPYYFRMEGLGTIIGTTTWGGLIGISGNPMLVDGGGVLYPTFRLYDPEGQWDVEGIGVAPDIEVRDLPEEIAAGRDPSVEKAVEILLLELETSEGDPERPVPPDVTLD